MNKDIVRDIGKNKMIEILSGLMQKRQASSGHSKKKEFHLAQIEH